MKILNVKPNTAEWLAERKSRYCASDAPAMKSASKYKSRTALLDQFKGAPQPEVTSFTQALFDKGHKTEDMARVHVELDEMEDLPPIACLEKIRGIKTELLASLDGYNEELPYTWEHKIWNETLVKNIEAGTLEPHHYWQLEHQCLVSGKKQVKFTCSDGTYDGRVNYMYESDPVREKELIEGWTQFEKDLEAHEIQAQVEKVEAAEINLPAIQHKVEGSVVTSNLADVIPQVKELAQSEMSKPLATDQDFADKEELVRKVKASRKDLKERVKAVQDGFESFSQFSDSVGQLDKILQELQSVSERAIKSEKEARKQDLITAGAESIQASVYQLDRILNPVQLGDVIDLSADLAGAMKNRRNLESMKGAIDDLVASKKSEIHAKATEIEPNVQAYLAFPEEHRKLVHGSELASVVNQSQEAFTAVMQARISEHDAFIKDRLAERDAAEKAKRDEEAAAKLKIEGEAEDKARRDAAAADQIKRDGEEAAKKKVEPVAVSPAMDAVQSEGPAGSTGTIKPGLESIGFGKENQLVISFNDGSRYLATMSPGDGPMTVAETLSQVSREITTRYKQK